MKPVHLGLIIGLVLGYVFGYNNIYARQKGHVRLKRAQIAQEQATQKARQETADLIRQADGYREQFAPEPDPSWLVREVLPYAQQVGLEFASIQQGAPQLLDKQKQFVRLSVQLEFPATYHQLGTFLDLVERSSRFVHVEQLNIQNMFGRDQTPRVALTLSSLYVSPVAGHPAAAAVSKAP